MADSVHDHSKTRGEIAVMGGAERSVWRPARSGYSPRKMRCPCRKLR